MNLRRSRINELSLRSRREKANGPCAWSWIWTRRSRCSGLRFASCAAADSLAMASPVARNFARSLISCAHLPHLLETALLDLRLFLLLRRGELQLILNRGQPQERLRDGLARHDPEILHLDGRRLLGTRRCLNPGQCQPYCRHADTDGPGDSDRAPTRYSRHGLPPLIRRTAVRQRAWSLGLLFQVRSNLGKRRCLASRVIPGNRGSGARMGRVAQASGPWSDPAHDSTLPP